MGCATPCIPKPFIGNEASWDISCARLPKSEGMKLNEEEIEAMFDINILCEEDKNPSAKEINELCREYKPVAE